MARVCAAVFGVAFGVSLLLPAAPTAAPNTLTGSDPRDGARVATAPERIELRFLASTDPATTKITASGPATAEVQPTPTESPTPTYTPMPRGESTGQGWWRAGIAAVVLLAVLAAARLLRRRASRR